MRIKHFTVIQIVICNTKKKSHQNDTEKKKKIENCATQKVFPNVGI